MVSIFGEVLVNNFKILSKFIYPFCQHDTSLCHHQTPMVPTPYTIVPTIHVITHITSHCTATKHQMYHHQTPIVPTPFIHYVNIINPSCQRDTLITYTMYTVVPSTCTIGSCHRTLYQHHTPYPIAKRLCSITITTIQHCTFTNHSLCQCHAPLYHQYTPIVSTTNTTYAINSHQ